MIRFSEINIQNVSDYNRLRDTIPKNLIDDVVVERLKKYIGLNCKKILIEYPYSERDYLSTYYVHYAMKFRPYSKYCCRLHILGDDEEYYGNITLRPTINGTRIGTTYLMPQIVIKEEAYLVLSKYKSHILGEKFFNECFPWMMQETDIAVCAHVAAWTVLRYYGNKYRNYADISMGDLIEKIQGDWGRKTPSNGLTPIQISELFKTYNYSPIVRGNSKNHGDAFLDELLAYIESGIPVVGFLSPKQHAVSIMGHGKIHYEWLDNEESIKRMKESGTDIILHSKLINSMYVMEDNYFAYRKVSKELPTADSDVDYSLYEISYVVVPLYSRMQLVYNEVYERYIALVKAKVMDFVKTQIARIYITSSNSLKSFVLNTQDINDDLKDIILTINMPRFIWCVDISSVDEYKREVMSGKIIIDTTCATYEKEPWILMHDSCKVKYIDYETGENREKSMNIKPYALYVNNLKYVVPAREEGSSYGE